MVSGFVGVHYLQTKPLGDVAKMQCEDDDFSWDSCQEEDGEKYGGLKRIEPRVKLISWNLMGIPCE